MIRLGDRENTMLKFLACATKCTEVNFVKIRTPGEEVENGKSSLCCLLVHSLAFKGKDTPGLSGQTSNLLDLVPYMQIVPLAAK